MKKTLADYWARRIKAQWQKSVEGIIGVGRQLIAAKEACEHGEFMRLFKGSENAVADPVPFTLNTAERLMRIARHPVLSNSAHVQTLPQSWGTLYELSQLDDDTLTAGIKAGEITPDMTRSQAAAMHADPVEQPGRAVHEAMADAVKQAVTRFIGQLTTPAQFAYVLSRLGDLSRFISEQQAEVKGAFFVTGTTSNTNGNLPAARCRDRIEAKRVSIEPAVIELFDAMKQAIRGECLDRQHAEMMHDHWLQLGEPLFSDFPLCRIRAPWREDSFSDAVQEIAAFAAGVQGKPAKVFRKMNVAARRIVRQLERCGTSS